MLSSYINRMMILLIVDVGTILTKAYWGTQTILAHWYQPKMERQFFNKYFILSVCSYASTVFKYGLIFVAFHLHASQVDCYFASANLLAGTLGSVLFAPCIYVALLNADKQHTILVKGAMHSGAGLLASTTNLYESFELIK